MNRLFVILPLFVLAGCAAGQPVQHGIPNFGVVSRNQTIYRGGQPTVEGWKWLKSAGVERDIKLNTDGEGDESEVALHEIIVLRFPVTTFQQLFGGRSMTLLLTGAAAAIGPRTFIHCSHGKNRTGTVVAYWRVKAEGYTKKQALEEALTYGWGDSLPGLKRFWKGVQPDDRGHP
jgi:tyrosine-protein phosphatase SIW14